MSYTDDQLQSISDAITRLDHAGKPEIGAKIAYMQQEGVSYDEIWELATADVKDLVRPEKPISDIVPPPPTTGPNSSTDRWRRFAKKVSDMDPEVIDSMGRNDLITVLADRGIIPMPDFILGGSDAEEE